MTGQQVLRIERAFDARIEQVFEAWTSPEVLTGCAGRAPKKRASCRWQPAPRTGFPSETTSQVGFTSAPCTE